MTSTPAAQAINNSTPTNAEKMRLLHWNYVRGGANTIFVQFTFFGSAFILFLNELQLNNSQIGLLLSFFPFLGTVAFFMAPSVGRFGYKRTWLWFFGLRKSVTLLLLLVPWVLMRSGPQFTLFYVGAIVLLFGLCRAISETAMFPWLLEIVPNSIRGRYTAINHIVINLIGVIAVTFASWFLEQSTGLNRFTFLIGVGVLFGFIAVAVSRFHPGGASTRGTQAENISQKDVLKSLRDTNFLRFVAGLGLVTLATAPMFSFLPLFMREQVGLSDGNVVLLQNGVLIGSLSATYLSGWAADRYGSKPVMLSGLWLMMLLPIGWLLIPRGSTLSLPIALAIALVRGAAVIMWGIGSSRMLYVSVVPFGKKTEYMGSYYALIGIIGGMSQLIGGRILDLFSNLSGTFSFVTIDSFTPVFLMSFILIILSQILFHFLRIERSMRASRFVAMFLHGNPFMAFESMIRYYRAKDEHTTVVMTERLGQAHSPLTVDELLEALQDPRFFVRFEAVVSMARGEPDSRYVSALIDILHGTELSLTVMAAWALGRIGDERAIAALRKGLDSPYRSIQAHCARALGSLGDETVIPELLSRLEIEADLGLQMAYASALGSLQASTSVQLLLNLLSNTENAGARMELALSVVRIVGNEQQFIQLLRQMRDDTHTTISQTLFTLGRKISDQTDVDTTLVENIINCSDLFGRGETDDGLPLLIQILTDLPIDALSDETRLILNEVAHQLRIHGLSRLEYLILVMDILGVIETGS